MFFYKYFSFKEVENKYLEQELQRDCLTKDLYINPKSIPKKPKKVVKIGGR